MFVFIRVNGTRCTLDCFNLGSVSAGRSCCRIIDKIVSDIARNTFEMKYVWLAQNETRSRRDSNRDVGSDGCSRFTGSVWYVDDCL